MEKATGSSPVAPTIKMIDKNLLRRLYFVKKLSMWGIAKELSITPAKVVYWMKKHDLSRRSSNESAYVKLNPNGDPFHINDKLTLKNKELLLLSLMLYWAEGSRKNKHTIQLANLDYRMLKMFIKFLKIICNVREDKLCLTIQLYRHFNREKVKNYWSRTLGVPGRLIAVNIHSDARSKPNEQWSKNGIARIEVRNVKLKRWLDSMLEAYLKKWA